MKGHFARWFMACFGIACAAGMVGWIAAATRRSQAAVERYEREVDQQPVP